MNPCPFCHTQVEETTNSLGARVHVCPCGVKFVIKEGELNSWSFNVTLHNEEFKLMFFTEMLGKPEFDLFDSKKLLLAFPFLPDITPQNAKEKVQLMLVFS